MGEAVKKFRCPNCQSAYTRGRIKTKDRFCNHCNTSYVEEIEEVEEDG